MAIQSSAGFPSQKFLTSCKPQGRTSGSMVFSAFLVASALAFSPPSVLLSSPVRQTPPFSASASSTHSAYSVRAPAFRPMMKLPTDRDPVPMDYLEASMQRSNACVLCTRTNMAYTHHGVHASCCARTMYTHHVHVHVHVPCSMFHVPCSMYHVPCTMLYTRTHCVHAPCCTTRIGAQGPDVCDHRCLHCLHAGFRRRGRVLRRIDSDSHVVRGLRGDAITDKPACEHPLLAR